MSTPNGARRPRFGLAPRVFVAQTLIGVVAAGTVWLVAAAVGPAIFHTHLHKVAGQVSVAARMHVEEAYRSASTLSIAPFGWGSWLGFVACMLLLWALIIAAVVVLLPGRARRNRPPSGNAVRVRDTSAPPPD